MDEDLKSIRTRPRRRSRSSGAVLNTPTPAPASASSERSLLPSDVLELRRSASADHVAVTGRRLSRSGYSNFSQSGGLGSSFRLNGAGSSFRAGAGVPVSSSALRSHASFLMMDIDAARQSVDAQSQAASARAASFDEQDDLFDGGRLTRNMLDDTPARRRSSGAERFRRASSLDSSPPLPPDSTISAEDVIRESMASALSSSLYTDKDEFLLPHQRRSTAVGGNLSIAGTVNERDSLAMSRHSRDSLAFSFSSRSTFRRSTISEQMLYETDMFEPERELSVRELSEVLSGSDEDITSYEVTSIKEEEEDVKLENAKSRWAQHVKLKARSFLYSTVSGNKASAASNNSGAASSSNPTDAEIWANKQKQILAQMSSGSGFGALSSAASSTSSSSAHHHSLLPSFGPAANSGAKFQKWNRWMHDQYQHNFGKVMQRAFKDEVLLEKQRQQQFAFPPHQAAPDPTSLISIEEVISNPRMMRYYAAWLPDPADQSRLFFLCSFEEYRQFWCTLRANYQKKPFAKDDVLMLRTYGVKILMKYLAKDAQFPINGAPDCTGEAGVEDDSKEPPIVDASKLRSIKRDLAAGGEDALRTFDDVAVKVKRVLMMKFPEFRKTELYTEMQKTVAREVICLEDILMNHRFANFFWIFLFPHNYHREIALWLDVEYEFKPAFRIYMALLKSSGSSSRNPAVSSSSTSSNQRRERIEQAAYRCRRLLKYISQKYYAGDEEMQTLSRTLVTSCARLQAEQDAILTKFSLIHLELYHRFLTSRAYAEFALYPKLSPEDEKDSIDDSMRLSALLLSYGLRAHHWAGSTSGSSTSSSSSSASSSRDGDAAMPKKKTLDSLRTARSFEAISGVITFEAVAVPPSADEVEGSADGNGGASFEDPIELHVVQHPLPHDPTPHIIDKSIENFLVPWSADPRHVVLMATSCPAPLAFNFRMGDSSAGASAAELFAACVVLYKPAPPLSRRALETTRIEGKTGCRWVPYGVCVLSKFPLVDLLRERLAEAYEFILELETIATAAAVNGDGKGVLHSVDGPGPHVFQLDKKVLAKLTRAVSKEHISQYHQSSPLPDSPLLEAWGLTPKATAASLLAALPRLDHSVRLLFDTLDVSTVLLVFTAALLESRILLVSSYLSVLMKVGESLRALMHPLLWPHVYLPVLPRRLLQYLECPTPFIFGAEKQALDEAQQQLMEEGGEDLFAGAGDELLVVDLDKGAVLRGEVPCALPDSVRFDLRDALYECLKPNVSRSDHVFAHHFPSKPLVFPELAVRGLFLRAVNKLIGDFGYHRYVWTDEFARKRTVFFDEASYLAASSPEMREFRTLFIATQAFSEFMVTHHGFEEQPGQANGPSLRSSTARSRPSASHTRTSTSRSLSIKPPTSSYPSPQKKPQ